MGFFNNDVIDKVAMKLVEPIANLKTEYSYTIYLHKDHILIKDILTRKDARLSLSQITNVFYGTETEIVEKDKSVVGRALAGTILTGGLPVGTLVGAISGVGTKKKKKNHTYLIIEFTSSDGLNNYIKFEDTFLDGRQFAKKLKELTIPPTSKHTVL